MCTVQNRNEMMEAVFCGRLQNTYHLGGFGEPPFIDGVKLSLSGLSRSVFLTERSVDLEMSMISSSVWLPEKLVSGSSGIVANFLRTCLRAGRRIGLLRLVSQVT
jgi:hypothetical protein